MEDVKFNLLLVGGRSKVRYRIGYDADGVPVLPAKHPLSRLYIREAHEIDHGGINSAEMRSRSKVWVMKGARMAKQVIADCYQCRLRRKVVLNQVMAPLPQERVGPTPIFLMLWPLICSALWNSKTW